MFGHRGKKMKEEVGARGRMSDRRRGSREGNGCARCPPNPFVTQRLIRVVSGRLVINRLWSVCLTGGILVFDGRTLISLENSPKTDGLTNRRISQKKNLFYQSAITSLSLQAV